MMRGVLTLMLGFVVGSGLMLSFWPHPPVGIAAPRSSDLRIFISDRYLARTIQDKFAGGAIPAVGDVQVESAPPTSLVIRLHVSVGPLSLPAALELAPVAENGSINVPVVSTDLAGVSIPGQLTVFVSSVINRQVNAVLHQAGRVTGVKILPAGIEVFANNP